jgi:hypothetical protein
MDLPAGRWKNCMSNIFRTPCTLQGRLIQEDELEGACSTCETKEMHANTHTYTFVNESIDFHNVQVC